MASDTIGMLLNVLTALPSLIKDGAEAIQLVTSTLATVHEAQAQGRDPTQAEWDAIHLQIDTMTGQLNAPEDPAPVGTGLSPVAVDTLPVAVVTTSEASPPVAIVDVPVPSSDAGSVEGAPLASPTAPAPETAQEIFDREDALAKADLVEFEGKAKTDLGIK